MPPWYVSSVYSSPPPPPPTPSPCSATSVAVEREREVIRRAVVRNRKKEIFRDYAELSVQRSAGYFWRRWIVARYWERERERRGCIIDRYRGDGRQGTKISSQRANGGGRCRNRTVCPGRARARSSGVINWLLKLMNSAVLRPIIGVFAPVIMSFLNVEAGVAKGLGILCICC